MGAQIVDLADAVMAALNGHVFTPAFVATRSYQPTYELKDAAELKVTVIPNASANQRVSRSQRNCDLSVAVIVQQKLAEDGRDAQMDGLLALVESIDDFLFGDVLEEATQFEGENAPLFMPDHLEQWNQFTSVLVVKFRATR